MFQLEPSVFALLKRVSREQAGEGVIIYVRRSSKQTSSSRVRVDWAYGFMVSMAAFALTFLAYNAYFIMDHGRTEDTATGASGHWRGWTLALAFDVPWLLCLLCYLRVLMIKPGKVPRRWTEYVTKNAIRVSVTEQSTFQPRTSSICGACMRHRPERAHHCSICGECVLRHDRHDWLIGTCVGFRNHKFYILFLFYGALASTLFLVFMVPHFVVRVLTAASLTPESSGASHPLPPAAARVLEASILLVAFLALPYFFYNLSIQGAQLCRNATSHEAEYVATNPYDLGTRIGNAAAVFGTDLGPLFLYWLLPVDPCRPESDGLFYPIPSSPKATPCSIEDGSYDESIQALLGASFGNTKRIDRIFDSDMKHLILKGRKSCHLGEEEEKMDETRRLAPSRSNSYSSCIL
ncbi:hypothetical protein FOZ60_014241 [Perkinsus olseni]|uniref:Palmitoyltransferase n=1 Tax=Perkinsus olseni TaxID=32597 RepID=A0A7J6P893_PEROL|nr:hypothetical protein FOZ60_014241 [Perkinsus olseni]